MWRKSSVSSLGRDQRHFPEENPIEVFFCCKFMLSRELYWFWCFKLPAVVNAKCVQERRCCFCKCEDEEVGFCCQESR